MNRTFLINIVFLLFVNLLVKPFYLFGIDRMVQNTVEEGSYGLYFALFNFTYLFQIINDFGIQSFNSRNIAQYNQLLDKYFPNILVLKGLLGIVYLLVVMVSAYFWDYSFDIFPFILLIAVNQILSSLIFFLRSNIAGLAMYWVDSVVSILDRLLLIIICAFLLWAPMFEGQFEIWWFVYAQTASLGIAALTAFIIVRRHIKTLNFNFHPPFLLLILKKSYPYALVVFLMTLYTRIDGVMIERMLSDGLLEADIYASAFRLLDASNMFAFLFATLLLPMFSKMIKEGESVAPLVRFSFQFIGAGAITLTFSILFFQEEIMVGLYDHGSAYSGQILMYLMISFLAMAGSTVYGTLLTANGSLMKMNVIFLIGVFLNVLLNWVFIPESKALGAAIASCITQGLVFFAQLFLAKQELKLRFAADMLIRILLFMAVLFAAMYWCFENINWGWLYRFILCLGLGGVLAFLFKLIDLRQLFELVRNR
jgi:O-antigen/teichoic acid export membrane protein